MDFSGNEGSGDVDDGKLGKSSSLHCCNTLLLSWNNTGTTSRHYHTWWGIIVGLNVFNRKAALLWTLSAIDSPFLCLGSCSLAGVSRHTWANMWAANKPLMPECDGVSVPLGSMYLGPGSSSCQEFLSFIHHISSAVACPWALSSFAQHSISHIPFLLVSFLLPSLYCAARWPISRFLC